MKKPNLGIVAVLLLLTASMLGAILLLYNSKNIKQVEETAIPVVVAYNKSQRSYSSAVHIGDGYFLTAAHILSNNQKEIVLETSLNQVFIAELVWSNTAYDISLFYAKDYDLVDIEQFNIDCSALSFGDQLRFIGNPVGLKFVTTWGAVSSYESISVENLWEKVLVVNASIVPGMSGGAAVDINNRLRGINVGTLRSIAGMSPFGTLPSFAGLSYIVESSDICLLMDENKQ